MATSHTKSLYEVHHQSGRSADFSLLKEERGTYFSNLIGSGKSVLDLGCRDGALTTYFLKGNDVLGADVDDIALHRASEKGIQTISMDIMGDWQELNGREFDYIVAGELLEHLFYPENIVRKVYEHLTHKGVFIGSVPNAFSLKNRLRYMQGSIVHTPLSDPTHINQFSSMTLEKILKKSFENVSVSGLGRYERLARISPNLFAFDLVFRAAK